MTLRSRLLSGIAVLALALGGALAVASPAAAVAFTVTSAGDSGPGTLREAIDNANAVPGADTISFALPGPQTITLVSALPVISTDLTIIGPGQSALTIDGPATVITVTGGPRITVTISDLTVASAGANADGISASDTTLTVSRVTASHLGGIGISVTDGSLIATDLTADDDGGAIAFVGNAVTDNLTLTRVHADGSLVAGIDALVTGGTASLTDITADNGTVGVGLEARAGAVVTASNVSVDGGAAHGFFLQAKTGSTMALSQLSVTNNGNSGIYLYEASGGATVSISDSTISGNSANDDGGGINVETFVGDGTSLTISDSTIAGNRSGDYGGGIYLREIGAGVTSTAKVVIHHTTLDGNHADGYGGAIAINEPAGETTGAPTVLIDSSTLSNNVTPYGGGGIHIRKNSGAAIAVLEILNSTISGNDAQVGGAIDSSGPGLPSSLPGSPPPAFVPLLTTVISHCTIAGNSAHTSGGVTASPQNLQIDNSIIAGSTSNNGNTPDDLDVRGSFIARYSLIQTPRAGVMLPASSGNITGVDPQLAPLANNGGPTTTRLVAPASPAFNAGDPAFAGTGLLDQRGLARVSQRVDIGATEWQAAVVPVVPALANTGITIAPEGPITGLLLILMGITMVAFRGVALRSRSEESH